MRFASKLQSSRFVIFSREFEGVNLQGNVLL